MSGKSWLKHATLRQLLHRKWKLWEAVVIYGRLNERILRRAWQVQNQLDRRMQRLWAE